MTSRELTSDFIFGYVCTKFCANIFIQYGDISILWNSIWPPSAIWDLLGKWTPTAKGTPNPNRNWPEKVSRQRTLIMSIRLQSWRNAVSPPWALITIASLLACFLRPDFNYNCLSVFLSVCQSVCSGCISSETAKRIWLKCCIETEVCAAHCVSHV